MGCGSAKTLDETRGKQGKRSRGCIITTDLRTSGEQKHESDQGKGGRINELKVMMWLKTAGNRILEGMS